MKLVKYVQEDCTPCKKLTTLLGFMQVTVDETVSLDDQVAKEKAKELNIMSTPTMILFDEDGQVVDRVSGDDVGTVQGFLSRAGRI